MATMLTDVLFDDALNILTKAEIFAAVPHYTITERVLRMPWRDIFPLLHVQPDHIKDLIIVVAARKHSASQAKRTECRAARMSAKKQVSCDRSNRIADGMTNLLIGRLVVLQRRHSMMDLLCQCRRHALRLL